MTEVIGKWWGPVGAWKWTCELDLTSSLIRTECL